MSTLEIIGLWTVIVVSVGSVVAVGVAIYGFYEFRRAIVDSGLIKKSEYGNWHSNVNVSRLDDKCESAYWAKTPRAESVDERLTALEAAAAKKKAKQ